MLAGIGMPRTWRRRPIACPALNGRTGCRGVALLTLVVLVALVSIGVTAYLIHPASAALERADAISKSLAIAHDALVGYATFAARPGELPCPDRDNDGLEDLPCNTPGTRLGRIPWATLGIEDPWRNQGPGGLSDNSGETLWYAVSDRFRPGWAGPINPDSTGDLTITHTAGPPSTNVVAVLIAPGPPLSGQLRTAAAQGAAANYLEGENASVDTTFAMAPTSGTFNDVVHPITQDSLMRTVTARVARVASASLQAYFKAHSRFPRARDYGELDCDPALTQGQLPMDANGGGCGAYADWPAGTPPAWFITNQWDRFVHYAVTPNCSDLGAAVCTSTSGTIVVTGLPAPVPAVVIVTGRALGSQVRPCPSVAHCLEAAENTNGDATFVLSAPNSNDRLAVVPIP
jgi:hypothetical protein